MEFDRKHDERVRKAAFDWLAGHVSDGGVVTRNTIARGFEYDGRRVPLMGRQGIFEPPTMELPLSIRSSASGPYSNVMGPDKLLRYKYRGRDPFHDDH